MQPPLIGRIGIFSRRRAAGQRFPCIRLTPLVGAAAARYNVRLFQFCICAFRLIVNVEFDDYCWLTSRDAEPYLQAAATSRGSPAEVARFRRDLSPSRTHLVLEQAELRRRARCKFARAAEMFFTRRGLEQATDQTVAAYKAARLIAAAASPGPTCDLCCGIGGDLLTLVAALSPALPDATVVAVDADPLVAHLATANVAVHGHATASVLAADVLAGPVQAALREAAAWHIDPDRRPTGQRRTRLEAFSPSLEQLQQLLEVNPAAAIKLAPASELPDAWNGRMEREWIGIQGECRQQVAWAPPLARHPGCRVATVLGGGCPRTVVCPPGEASPVPIAGAAAQYLFEPHAAVLAAGLADVLAAEHGIARLTANVAYFTGDHPVTDPALAAFEVVEVLPLRAKEIARWLAARGMGRVEVKKRGVDVDPLKLQRQWQGRGDGTATLIVAPVAGRVTVHVTRRISGG